MYFNSEEVGFEQRKKLNQQALNHVSALRNLIGKSNSYIPSAIHFLPFDYVVLNSPHFSVYFNQLKNLERSDEMFQKALQGDMLRREYTEANVNFLLEERVVAHIARQHFVDFPRTLVKRDVWRLLVYPGFHIGADAYQIQKNILPQTDNINPYAFGQYDYENKVFNDYRNLKS